MELQKSLFIFRRDLRLEDNTALIAALSESKEVACAFFFDPRQVNEDANPYFSKNAFQFMLLSLGELAMEIEKKGGKLRLFLGKPEDIIGKLDIDAVFVNRDYTPFSIKRDSELAKACKKGGIAFHSFGDALLCEPELVHKPDGKPYTVFSHYFRSASKFAVSKPTKNTHSNYFKGELKGSDERLLYKMRKKLGNKNTKIAGGRKRGLGILERISDFRHYASLRNLPAKDGTTKLSAHHKFGTVSIRETYHAIASGLSENHPLINEIYWRDFFTYIACHFPHVFGAPFNRKYENLRWKGNEARLLAWKEGKTGFPIVDAGMRELNATGFMHNRVRMIVASFLTKDLHIDWREGEMHFARHLLDFDPCVNNGNWQWSASTGCDAQPYFRIFNPWLQQKRFDPDCEYIKKWVPELSALPPRAIHALEKGNPPKGYPSQIVVHGEEARLSKFIFSQASKGT